MVELKKVDKHFSVILIKSSIKPLHFIDYFNENVHNRNQMESETQVVFMAKILNKRNPLNNFIYVKYVNN